MAYFVNIFRPETHLYNLTGGYVKPGEYHHIWHSNGKKEPGLGLFSYAVVTCLHTLSDKKGGGIRTLGNALKRRKSIYLIVQAYQ